MSEILVLIVARTISTALILIDALVNRSPAKVKYPKVLAGRTVFD
jgi:hypothetical protein